jgi:phospholipid-binding lipoprotein MlaA
VRTSGETNKKMTVSLSSRMIARLLAAALAIGLAPAAIGAASPTADDLPDAASVLPRPARDPDPWVGMNRKLWAFNEGLDNAILTPIARGYTTIMPDLLEEGVSNFFDNLQVPGTALNQLLQAKPGQMASDIGRFVFNSTFGVLGLFDVASRLGLPQHDEDFGQTLAVWGIPQGPYFMIPIRGPSTVTHAGGMLVDAFTNPIRYIRNVPARNGTYALYFLDLRKRLLSAEVLVSGDEYLFIRDAYLQRRDYLIRDGAFEEDPFMDFEDF